MTATKQTKKCAIIEYENYSGRFPPVIIEIGAWWKLWPKLMAWSKSAPSFATGHFCYIGMIARIEWEGYAGRNSSTVRRIVEIGKDHEGKPFVEHLKIRWF